MTVNILALSLYEGMTVGELKRQLDSFPEHAVIGTPTKVDGKVFRMRLKKPLAANEANS